MTGVNVLSPQSIAEYMGAYRTLIAKQCKRAKGKTLKISFLGSFTMTGMKEVLFVKCHEIGLKTEFYEAPYNQFAQMILDKNSEFYRFNADLTVLFIDIMNLLGEDFFFPYRLSDKNRKTVAEEKCVEVINWTKMLIARGSGKVVLHNFQVPHYSPVGILENKRVFGFFDMVRMINARLAEAFRHDSRVFVFDYDGFCARYGKARVTDRKMYYLGDFRLGFEYIPLLCDEYLAYIKPLASLTKKCLVLDLDNTLWGGVIGEDGLEGIKLGPTPEGRPFLEFQKYILNLVDRGVILAINSSNNPEDVDRVFREHPNMVLRKENFSAIEVNWNDKVTNMRAISKQLNIGLDALVFLDDLGANREMIRAAFPEVRVPEFPEDPSEYVPFLMGLTDFSTFQLTEEDRNRNRLYATDQRRKEHRQQAADLDDFLKDLKTVVTISPADTLTTGRISQLTQKTNQFNMTTRRFLEEDIKCFAAANDFLVYSVKVEDKFGDNGIAGVVILKKEPTRWVIDTFLLSCRVIGRKVEEAVLSFIIAQAGKAGIQEVVGHFIPTAKNLPAKDFYKNSGFFHTGTSGSEESWTFALAQKHHSPNFIEVVWKG